MDEAGEVDKLGDRCVGMNVNCVRMFRGGCEQLTMLQSYSVLYGSSATAGREVDVARSCKRGHRGLAGVVA